MPDRLTRSLPAKYDLNMAKWLRSEASKLEHSAARLRKVAQSYADSARAEIRAEKARASFYAKRETKIDPTLDADLTPPAS